MWIFWVVIVAKFQCKIGIVSRPACINYFDIGKKEIERGMLAAKMIAYLVRFFSWFLVPILLGQTLNIICNYQDLIANKMYDENFICCISFSIDPDFKCGTIKVIWHGFKEYRLTILGASSYPFPKKMWRLEIGN